MLQKIKDFYNDLIQPVEDDPVSGEHHLRLAATALMIEVMRVDDHKSDSEIETVLVALMEHFGIERDEADTIMRLANEELHQSTDYHQFTSLINQGYDQQQRQQIVEFLWQVAYADGELDKYEEHVIRKVSDLLYVSHKDFIRLKEKVRTSGSSR